jgi:hypothetical protein
MRGLTKWKARITGCIDVIQDDDNAFGICEIGCECQLKDADHE